MSLIRLRAEHVRCIETVQLEPTANNLIFGENASGKTSLLEALFILGRGRSFRGPGRSGVIRDGQDTLTVAGRVRPAERNVDVGIELSREGAPRIRIDREPSQGLATLAEWVPVQIIDPAIHQLVDEGPGVRRRFMDWGVFHVEHNFLETWRRYQRCLRQRNAALREGRGQIASWDDQLVLAATGLTELRRRYLERLRPHVERIGEHLLGAMPEMEYRQGWPGGKEFSQALVDGADRDVRFGITHVGPHRADVSISLAERSARGRVSRGQQKLLASALILGQLEHLITETGLKPILLVDDLPAELDKDSLGKVLQVISTVQAQVFVTALEADSVRLPEPVSVFHVERGKVRSVL